MTMHYGWATKWWLVATLGMGACADEDEMVDEMDNVDFRALDTTTFNTVCPNTRLVGWLKPNVASCPSIPGFPSWSKSKVFEKGTTYLADLLPPPALPSGLARFCAYDWTGGAPPDNPAVNAVKNHANFVPNEVKPDCNGILPQESLTEVLSPEVRELFKNRLELLEGSDVDTTPNADAPVQVFVVDTIPYGGTQTPNDEHGLIMAKLIRDIACPGSQTCAVSVNTVLGLSLTKEDGVTVVRDTVNGGYFGRQSEVAAAIYEAVHRWENTVPAANKGKLIINLSIGWEPAWFGDYAVPPPAVRAVYHALEVASCKGALVFSAAGNDTSACTTGGTAPGKWEMRPAPDQNRCTALGVNFVGSSSTYKPLLHAAGGVNWDDEKLEVGRLAGRPRLAGTASHAIGKDEDDTAYTGTSMASAIASGIGAATWTYVDGLDAHRVADHVHGAGIDLNEDADFWLSGSNRPEIHRMSVCRTLQAACAAVPTSCGDVPWVAQMTCDQGTLDTTDLFAAAAGVQLEPLVSPTFISLGSCPGYCGEDIDTQVPLGSGLGCPSVDGEYRTNHLTAPQPNDPACPTCTISTSNGQVNATQHPRNDQYQVEWILVESSNGVDDPISDTFPNVTLNSSVTVPLDARTPPSPVKEASITIKYVGYAKPITDDLIVVP